MLLVLQCEQNHEKCRTWTEIWWRVWAIKVAGYWWGLIQPPPLVSLSTCTPSHTEVMILILSWHALWSEWRVFDVSVTPNESVSMASISYRGCVKRWWVSEWRVWLCIVTCSCHDRTHQLFSLHRRPLHSVQSTHLSMINQSHQQVSRLTSVISAQRGRMCATRPGTD